MVSLYKELENSVISWAHEKGIMSKGDTMSQAIKTAEEANEVLKAVNNDDFEAVKDELGDVFVTIIIQAEMQGVDLLQCLWDAYEKISKRNGKMINGTFVKEEDL